MNITGENICHVCGSRIGWLAHIPEGGCEVVNFGTNREARAIATGSLTTTNGKSVKYDIIVSCPKCHTENKFETVK